MKNTRSRIAQVALLSLLVTSLYATEEIADYRHETMEAVGAHFDGVIKILRGEIPYDDHLPMHVNALADIAEILPSLFVEGSEGGEALDSIWEEPEEFAEKVSDFQSAMKELKAAVDAGDPAAIGPSISAVGQACKGCHDDYRE